MRMPRVRTWADRGYVNFGFGVESGSSSLSETANLVIYEEAATVTSSTEWTSGSLLDAGFGVRVWRNLTVGLGYHQEENDTDSQMTGSIPSPIFFNRPRTLAQDVVLERKEKAAHLVIRLGRADRREARRHRFRRPLILPARTGCGERRRDRRARVTVHRSRGGCDVTTQKKSLTGYNVGVDATYIVWSNDDVRLGVGGFVRFTQATGDIQMMTTTQETEVGGVQFGFGGQDPLLASRGANVRRRRSRRRAPLSFSPFFWRCSRR